MFEVLYAKGAGFDSRLCSFRFGGSGYVSYFWWERLNSFAFVFTL